TRDLTLDPNEDSRRQAVVTVGSSGRTGLVDTEMEELEMTASAAELRINALRTAAGATTWVFQDEEGEASVHGRGVEFADDEPGTASSRGSTAELAAPGTGDSAQTEGTAETETEADAEESPLPAPALVDGEHEALPAGP